VEVRGREKGRERERTINLNGVDRSL